VTDVNFRNLIDSCAIIMTMPLSGFGW